MKKSVIIAFAVMFIAIAYTASGAGFAYEPFTDPAFGPASGIGQWAPASSWTWVQNPGTATHDPVGLTYKSLQTAPGACQIAVQANDSKWARDFASTYSATNDDYWVSFLIRIDQDPIRNNIYLTPDGDWDACAIGYQWSDTINFANGTNTGMGGVPGVTNMIVLHFSPDGGDPDRGTCDYWVDPALTPIPGAPLGTELPPGWSPGIQDSPSAMFKMGLRGQDPDGLFTVDEIRYGQSWESVTVPEPATFSLLGIGLLALIRRKK